MNSMKLGILLAALGFFPRAWAAKVQLGEAFAEVPQVFSDEDSSLSEGGSSSSSQDSSSDEGSSSSEEDSSLSSSRDFLSEVFPSLSASPTEKDPSAEAKALSSTPPLQASDELEILKNMYHSAFSINPNHLVVRLQTYGADGEKAFREDFENLPKASSETLTVSLGKWNQKVLQRVIGQIFKNPDHRIKRLLIDSRAWWHSGQRPEDLLARREQGEKYYPLKKLEEVDIEGFIDAPNLHIFLKYAENLSSLSLGKPDRVALWFVSEYFEKLGGLTLGSWDACLSGKETLEWIESFLPTWLPVLKELTLFSTFEKSRPVGVLGGALVEKVCPLAAVGELPRAFQLRSLHLAGPSSREPEPFVLEPGQAPGVFPLLEKLRLSRMDLGSLSQCAVEMPRLKALHLSNCKGMNSSDICGLLHKVPTLMNLDLKGDFVEASKAPVKLPEDRALHLSLALKDGSHLARVLHGDQLDKHLESLNLEQRGIDEALAEISKRVFPSLTALHFAGEFPEIERLEQSRGLTEIEDKGFRALPSPPRLHSKENFCKIEELEEIMRVKDSFPQLKSLNVWLRGKAGMSFLEKEYEERFKKVFQGAEIKIDFSMCG